jgi:S-methylmethionine-dependent homocysteine/selenocysteine methylase
MVPWGLLLRVCTSHECEASSLFLRYYLDDFIISQRVKSLISCGDCSGDYGPDMTVEKLKDFHRRRLAVLSDAGPDLLALETIPCKLETQVHLLFLLWSI